MAWWIEIFRPSIGERFTQIERLIMATSAELQEKIDAYAAQAAKVFTEVTEVSAAQKTEIEALKAQLAVAGVEVDFSGLEANLQRLDDLTPDAIDPEPPVDPVDPESGGGDTEEGDGGTVPPVTVTV